MPRLSIWNSGKKGNTWRYIDRTISSWFGAGGTACFVHLYLGTHDQTVPSVPTIPTPPSNLTSIQDVLLLENRDRKYSNVVYELRGVYSVTDTDFDLRQFGLFLSGDTLFIEFHMSDMIVALGRKLMPGDVLELPHQRDENPINGGPAINKFYVVEDGNRASDGYSPTWWPHIWRVKVSPMTGATEYQDILDKQAKNPLGFDQGKISDLISTIGVEMGINEAVVEAARESVQRRNFETRQFWMIPGEETGRDYPWIFAGDGIPPNGAVLLGAGVSFPLNGADEGAYFLRTDYEPHALFRRLSGKWRIQELDYRKTDWTAANRVLLNFINNTEIFTADDGTVEKQRQALSKAVRPRADF